MFRNAHHMHIPHYGKWDAHMSVVFKYNIRKF